MVDGLTIINYPCNNKTYELHGVTKKQQSRGTIFFEFFFFFFSTFSGISVSLFKLFFSFFPSFLIFLSFFCFSQFFFVLVKIFWGKKRRCKKIMFYTTFDRELIQSGELSATVWVKARIGTDIFFSMTKKMTKKKKK